MAGTGSSVAWVAQRRIRVLECQRKGIMSPRAIANKLGEKERLIRRDLEYLNQQITEEVKSLAREVYIGRQLARINHLYGELEEAWEKSKQPDETLVAKVRKKPIKSIGADGKPVIVEETNTEQRRRNQCGDPAYVHATTALMQHEASLLGLEALAHAQQRAAEVQTASGIMDMVRQLSESKERARIIDVDLGEPAETETSGQAALPAPEEPASDEPVEPPPGDHPDDPVTVVDGVVDVDLGEPEQDGDNRHG